MGILECMIDPEFPYVPRNEDKLNSKENDAWSTLPNVKPQRYNAIYKLLDGDQYGRAKHEPHFDFHAHSGLYDIAHSPFSDVSISKLFYKHLPEKIINNIVCFSMHSELNWYYGIFLRTLYFIYFSWDTGDIPK